MGVTDTVRDTATSIAGAGADILLEGAHGVATIVKAGWTAPPLKIPMPLKVGGKGSKKTIVAYTEIPPALVMVGIGAMLAYGYLRIKGISPFDWLWAEINKVRDTTGSAGMSDAERAARAAAVSTGEPQNWTDENGLEHTVVPTVKPGQSSGPTLTTDAKRYIAGIPAAFSKGGLQGDDLIAAQTACQIGTPKYALGFYNKQTDSMELVDAANQMNNMVYYDWFYDALYYEYAAEKTWKVRGANYAAVYDSTATAIWSKAI